MNKIDDQSSGYTPRFESVGVRPTELVLTGEVIKWVDVVQSCSPKLLLRALRALR